MNEIIGHFRIVRRIHEMGYEIWLTTGNSVHIYLKAARDKTYFRCSWKENSR